PKVDSKQLELVMFDNTDSPVGLVNCSDTPKFFEKLVDNDPTKNGVVIMHLRLRPYRNSPKLYGEVEEIVFLEEHAPNCYQPLILDQIEVGWKLPEGKPSPTDRPEIGDGRDKAPDPSASAGDLASSLDHPINAL